MFKLFRKKMLYSPCDCICKDLTLVEDSVFSQKMMGDGLAFEPKNNQIFAPFNAVVKMVFPTKHAIGLVDEDDNEWILHIGIDTVSLKGEGFDVKVKEGQSIKACELLVEVDFDLIESKGFKKDIILVSPNTKKLKLVLKENLFKAKQEISNYECIYD